MIKNHYELYLFQGYTMKKKYLPENIKIFKLFVISQLFWMVVFKGFILFITFSFFYIGYIFYLKGRDKYTFSIIYVFLTVVSIFINYNTNPNHIYKPSNTLDSGVYFVRDSSGMKRGEFPFYKKNNYIFYDLDSGRKFKVYCSLYLDKCNPGYYLNKKIFVKYLSVGSGVSYLYYIEAGGSVFTEKYFIEKYKNENKMIYIFYIFYISFNILFLYLLCFNNNLKNRNLILSD